MAFQKWQVLSGSHYQNRKSYKKGSKFITDRDMNKFNTIPQAPKYRLLGVATEAEILQFQADAGFTGTPEPEHIESDDESLPEEETTEATPVDSLEAMTVPELKALAKDETIDISGIHTKADILARIRAARAE